MVGSARNPEPGACALGDGQSYCRMAEGALAYSPFSRRLLIPAAVRVLGFLSVADRFQIFDVLGLLVASVMVGYLARCVARERGIQEPSIPWVIAAAVLVFLVSPYGVRMMRFAPVLVDLPALGLGLLATVSLATAGRLSLLTAPAASALAVLAREAWAPLLITMAAALVAARTRARTAAALVIAACGMALVVGLRSPHLGPDLSPVRVGLSRLRYYSGTHGLNDLTYQLTLGVGLFPLLLVLLWSVDLPALRRMPVTMAMLATATVALVEGALGGTDVGRISYTALPLLLALTFPSAAATTQRSLAWATSALTLVSVAVWQPWAVLRGQPGAYAHLLYFSHRSQATYLAIVWLAVLSTAALRLRIAMRDRSRGPVRFADGRPDPL